MRGSRATREVALHGRRDTDFIKNVTQLAVEYAANKSIFNRDDRPSRRLFARVRSRRTKQLAPLQNVKTEKKKTVAQSPIAPDNFVV